MNLLQPRVQPVTPNPNVPETPCQACPRVTLDDDGSPPMTKEMKEQEKEILKQKAKLSLKKEQKAKKEKLLVAKAKEAKAKKEKMLFIKNKVMAEEIR